MKPILITGGKGQVGYELMNGMNRLGNVIGLDREEIDLADSGAIRETVRAIRPALIVNAAAYTAVDKAESDPDLAMAVNGIAPGVLAEEAKRIGAALIHYSTDYVFNGTKAAPYTEEDEPNPLSVYGKTKLAGERAVAAVGLPHLILRTSWVYGLRGQNFLLTILRLAKEREVLTIVDDQIGAPTWCRMVSDVTVGALRSLGWGEEGWEERLSDLSGVYHATASGQTSWYGFTAAILAATSSGSGTAASITNIPRLTPILTHQYPLPAPRPLYSVLANGKLQSVFGLTLPKWESGLADCLRTWPKRALFDCD